MGSNLSLSIWGYFYKPLLETPVLLLLLVLKSAFESLPTGISRLIGNTSTTLYNQMKLLTAIAAAALTFAPISAFAVNVKPLRFAPNSYCGNVASSNTWYTVKAKKGQTVRVGFDTEFEYYQLKVVNTTLGTTVKLKNGGVHNHMYIFSFVTGGNYTYRLETRESGTKIGNKLSVCIE